MLIIDTFNELVTMATADSIPSFAQWTPNLVKFQENEALCLEFLLNNQTEIAGINVDDLKKLKF